MPIPTDRGYVVITKDDAGKQTVMIGTKPNNGHPDTVYAMYVSPNGINVHADVAMLGNNSWRFTAEMAEVYVDDEGIVHIATVQGLTAVTLPA